MMENFNFKKKFGQNFLSDKNLLEAICNDAEIDKNTDVLEIGAGGGALTQVLARKARKVVSYEIDKELQSALEGLNLENVQFIFKDALKEPLKEIEKNFEGEYKLVANLPYYITTPLLFKFLEESKKVNSLTVMVQKEVADRICSSFGGKDYGVLTVMTNFFGTAKITRKVSRAMFNPQPNVDSAVVNITRGVSRDVDRKEFYEFVKACFSMRRKTLANNLSSFLGISKSELCTLLSSEILSRRAETFSTEALIEIFKSIKNKKS